MKNKAIILLAALMALSGCQSAKAGPARSSGASFSHGGIVINEACGRGTDYVELYNNSDHPITLRAGEWSVKGQGKMEKPFILTQDIILKAKGFAVIIQPGDIKNGKAQAPELSTVNPADSFDGIPAPLVFTPAKDKDNDIDPEDRLSLKYKVKDGGDIVELYYLDELVDSLILVHSKGKDMPLGTGAYSCGRYPDGSDNFVSNLKSTPGWKNEAGE